MIEWTDRHCRFFHRLLAPTALLYTEMVTTGAVLHRDPADLLRFRPEERPLALQLGGSEPAELGRSAAVGEAMGYDEINLNLGCPSDRVQKGRFGACLMAEPERVAECVAAIREAVALPVTVKTRIGIDDCDEEPFLHRFIERVAAAGCRTFIIHARKAWLQGLSPKENREIPPLRHELVHGLKAVRPELEIVINGGITGLEQARHHLRHVDGVMIGREAYQNPMALARFAHALLGEGEAAPDRTAILRRMADYADEEAANGVPVKAVARHLLGLCNGLPGARRYRRRLAEGMHAADAGPDLLLDALAEVRLPATAPPPSEPVEKKPAVLTDA